MRRHAKAECLQVGGHSILGHATRFQGLGVVIELVETLPASDQLGPPEKDVE